MGSGPPGYRLAESIPWNRFPGSIKVLKIPLLFVLRRFFWIEVKKNEYIHTSTNKRNKEKQISRPILSKEQRQTKVLVPQLSKERRRRRSEVFVPLNYRRNEDKAKYLFLNYRRNEDEAKYSFLNY